MYIRVGQCTCLCAAFLTNAPVTLKEPLVVGIYNLTYTCSVTSVHSLKLLIVQKCEYGLEYVISSRTTNFLKMF